MEPDRLRQVGQLLSKVGCFIMLASIFVCIAGFAYMAMMGG